MLTGRGSVTAVFFFCVFFSRAVAKLIFKSKSVFPLGRTTPNDA